MAGYFLQKKTQGSKSHTSALVSRRLPWQRGGRSSLVFTLQPTPFPPKQLLVCQSESSPKIYSCSLNLPTLLHPLSCICEKVSFSKINTERISGKKKKRKEKKKSWDLGASSKRKVTIHLFPSPLGKVYFAAVIFKLDSSEGWFRELIFHL